MATETRPMFDTEELVINMGPQHPSTHGVLRVVLRLDGEKVVDSEVVIGYLHRGIEKLSENRNWTQIILLTDRMDYVAAATNNRFQIQVFAANEIVPPLAAADAVQKGTVEMAQTASYYYFGKDAAFTFGTALPFGVNTRGMNAWLRFGDVHCEFAALDPAARDRENALHYDGSMVSPPSAALWG